jgi:hypothetical protein
LRRPARSQTEARRWWCWAEARNIDFDDIQAQKRYRAFRAYGISKLANVLFTRELACRLEGTGITVNTMQPGLVATNFGARMTLMVQWILSWFGMSPEKGARTAIYLARVSEIEGVSGNYFYKQKEVRPAAPALDDAAARRRWEVSEVMTGLEATLLLIGLGLSAQTLGGSDPMERLSGSVGTHRGIPGSTPRVVRATFSGQAHRRRFIGGPNGGTLAKTVSQEDGPHAACTLHPWLTEARGR